LEVAHHRRPRVGALAVAVIDREQLLGAVLPDADDHEQAQHVVLAEPDADVDAIDEPVGIAVEAQPTAAKRLVLGLPSLGQPLDRARRQTAGVLAKQVPQRRREVAGREPVQVKDRQHFGHLRRPPRVRRKDPRAEPLALPGLLVDALVVDPRSTDRDRAGPDRHLPLTSPAVADHQPAALLIDLAIERGDVVVDLCLQRRRDHPPSALPSELVESGPDLLAFLPDRERANI
jgi:hypothetical protein